MRPAPLPSAVLVACLFLCACATATRRPDVDPAEVTAEADRMYEMVVERDQKLLARLSDLSTPLLIGNADLCDKKTKFIIALSVHNLADYRGRRREAMERTYGLDEFVRVTTSGRGGPAYEAGLRPGDVIVSANGVEVPDGMPASRYNRQHLIPMIESGKPITIVYLRGAEKKTAVVTPVMACDYPVRLKTSSVINAYANGSSITVHTALLDAFSNDEEVGVVLGHELAHNIMGHMRQALAEAWAYTYLARILNQATGTNVGSVYARFEYLQGSVDREYEADYVGLYLAARAGLPIEMAPQFLRRLAVDEPGDISRNTTHPQYARRFVAQEAAIKEIRRKKALGLPLLPEMKNDPEEKGLKDGVLPEGAKGK